MVRPGDFNALYNRRKTGSLKYDSAVRHGHAELALPLWLADMDFQTAPPVLEAMQARVRHGIFGYGEPLEDYYEAVMTWWRTYHRYTVEREWILESPGAMFSIGLAIKAFTRPGDGVMIQTPAHAPFFSVIEHNKRKPVLNPLLYERQGYSIDFDDFRDKIQSEKVKLFILCSPHSPTGRVWTLQELQQMGNICQRNGVVIVSDEVWCDMVAHGFTHRVLAGINPTLNQYTVTLTSPCKTFNLSGLQLSHAFIANDKLRKAWVEQKKASGYDAPSILGMTACQAAYERGRPWLDSLHAYINENDSFVRQSLKQYTNGITVTPRQATYMLWLNCAGVGFGKDELSWRMHDKGMLWLLDGQTCGAEGNGFLQLNIACPRDILQDAMLRMAVVLRR